MRLVGTEPIRVIVVDDQQVYRDTARMVVELTEGFELAGTAESGEEALELVDHVQPDLVLMDINMPGIDGLETTRRLTERRPDTAVIIFSTHSATDFAERAREAGAIGFISKSDLGPGVLTDLVGSRRHSEGAG